MNRLLVRGTRARFAAMLLGASHTQADDVTARWPQFRGPGGAGVAAAHETAPAEFGPENGLLWKTPLPVGHSSPAIWGDRIFVTGYQPEAKRLETLCLDRASGRILWRRSVPTEAIEPVHDISNPAAPTPVTDGKAVFVYFGSYGLVAYDFEGRERWSRPLPLVKTFFNQGSGTSPILAGDRLLLELTLEKESYLLAVRTDNGETIWKTSKPEWNGGWATPLVWNEGEEAVVGVFNPGRFTAYSLRDGSERWWINDLPLETCATPVTGNGVLFMSASGVQGEKDNVTLPPSFAEMVAHYDQNGNGRVELDEIPETLLVTDRRSGKGAGDMPLRGWIGFFTPAETKPDGEGRRARGSAPQRTAHDLRSRPVGRHAQGLDRGLRGAPHAEQRPRGPARRQG